MFHPVSLRSGVMASVMQMKRSVQTPVSLVRSLSGFALRLPVSAAQTSQAAGPRDAANAHTLRTRIVIAEGGSRTADDCGLEPSALRNPQSAMSLSVVLSEVHAGVQARDLVAVAVEHQRLAHQEFADAALGRLAPARMIDRRVHVRVEAVLVRRLFLPRVQGLLLDELHLHDRLDVLEPVLPGDPQPPRRAVLVRQHRHVEYAAED